MKNISISIRLILIYLLLISTDAVGQNNWLMSAGGAGNDEVLKSTTDSLGNIYSIGYFSLASSFGAINLVSGGSGDIFITKQNSLGEYIWATKAGGPQSDRGNSISIDKYGNILITGYYSAQAVFGPFTLSSINSSQDIFVAKLDYAGNFLWANSYGGPDIDLAFSIQTDTSGNGIITGQFKDTVQFSSVTLTSTINPTTNFPGFDIFLLKVDLNGNFLWVKKGAAKYDDRGITLATDKLNNIYLSGQFSDTLQFTNTYVNNGYNASFLMKMDSSGNEIWFRKLFATQVLVNEIKYEYDKIYLTGDFQGTLSIIGPNNDILTNPFPYKIFVLQLDTSGTVRYKHADGSDNFITSLSLDIDARQHTFCTGLFKCTFSQYSQSLAPGIFNSAGFRDVFISEYDSMLERLTSKQYGGSGDDFCSSLSMLTGNTPVIAGSFERNFNIPEGANFITNSTTHDSSAFGPGWFPGFCGDNFYGKFISVSSQGNKDLFSVASFDSSRLAYDFFERTQNNCQRDTLMPFINNQEDSIVGCDSVRLFISLRTGKDGVIGPAYDYAWSSGQTTDSIFVTSTGWYFIHFNYKDECRVFYDSIYVKIYTKPLPPDILVSKGRIVTALPMMPCFNKLIVSAPDTAILTAGNIPPGYSFHWNTPYGIVSNINANAYTSGSYSLTVSAPGGGFCSVSNCIEVFYYDTILGGANCLPVNLVPEIHFTDSIFDATNTVTVCRGDLFSFILVDSTWHSMGYTDSLPTFAAWTKYGGFELNLDLAYDTTFNYHLQIVRADSAGNCTLTAQILNPFTLLPLVSVTRNFYLNVLPTPSPIVNFNGPALVCPGDTVMLTLTGGANYQCTGPGIIATSINNDTLYVNRQGIYFAKYLVTDPVSGCSDSGTVVFNLVFIPAPLITMIPGDGIICPNDSVELIAEPGINYEWVGPLGNIISTTQNTFATVNGIYHYTLTTASGCILLSESKEVKGYSTPYLLADPGPVLCPGGSVDLHVYSNDTTQIQWQAPLSGNSQTQTVNSPGTYFCSVTSCGITTTVSINITMSNLLAEIVPPGPVTICQNSILTLQTNPGMIIYNWMPGQVNSMFYNVSTAGTYSVEITDLNGCTSTDTIVVDTFPLPPSPIVQDITICAGDSVSLIASSPGSINWYSSANSTIPIATGNIFQTPAISTEVTYYVTNSDSICESVRVPVTVFVNPASLLPLIFSDTLICRHDTLILSTNFLAGVNYYWTGPNSFSSSSQTSMLINFDSVNVGYYFLHISDSQCTSPMDSVFINLYQFSPFSLTSNSPLCVGDSLQLTATFIPAASYNWTGPVNFSSNQQNPQIQNMQINQAGNYSLTVTENGCVSNPVVLNITVNPLPSIPIILGDSLYCTNDTLILITNPLPGATYSWLLPSGLIVTGDSLVINNVDSNITGNIILTVTINGCQNQNTIHVNVASVPFHTIISNAPLCEGDTLRITTTSYPGEIYHWTGPNGFLSSTANNSIDNVTISNSGNYTLTTELNGCFSKPYNNQFSIYDYPEFDLRGDTTICEGTSFTVSIPQVFNNYNWNNTTYTSTYTVADSGLVTLSINNNSVCFTEKTFKVDAIDCNYFIPNVFTPNGDGMNDNFEITYNNAQNINLMLYNRWGEKLKTLNGTNIQWDGSDNSNSDLPAGTYLYLAKVVDYFGVMREYKGTIELIK